jgi:predicted Zn-dependent peptidase
MIINVKSQTGSSGFYIVFDGSTMNEKPGWYGISHLLEHLQCKSFEHLQNVYQQKNIKWNAYTSNDHVCFFMKGLDRHINEYKKEFLDLILSYEPTQEQLDNEKKIVLEEYKMSFNSQISSHYYNLQRKMFNYYNAIGLRSDIEKFTLQDCKEYLDLFYKQPTKVINISMYNDFESDVIFRDKIIAKPLEIKNYTNLHIITSDDETNVPEGLIPLEIINDYKNKVSIINSSKVLTEDFANASFLCEMLGSGLNSPLYKEVREKLGLVYSISCYNDKLNNVSSMISISTDTSNKNIDIVQNQIKSVLENKEQFLTQERFDIVKDNYITRLEEAEILNYSNVGKYLDEPEWRIESIIHTVTLKDVHNMVDKYLKWDDLYKSVDKTEFSN